MMDLGDVVLSEASRSQKDKPCALGACRGGPQWSHTHRGGWRRQGLGGRGRGVSRGDTVPVWDDWVLVSGSGGSCAVRTRSAPLDRALKNG